MTSRFICQQSLSKGANMYRSWSMIISPERWQIRMLRNSSSTPISLILKCLWINDLTYAYAEALAEARRTSSTNSTVANNHPWLINPFHVLLWSLALSCKMAHLLTLVASALHFVCFPLVVSCKVHLIIIIMHLQCIFPNDLLSYPLIKLLALTYVMSCAAYRLWASREYRLSVCSSLESTCRPLWFPDQDFPELRPELRRRKLIPLQSDER